ncbi:MAG TPA: energy transducer TonB [Oceanipulchritudo sp.]|nr:energy transducer TonB [Oceanipulchritudo sp.]
MATAAEAEKAVEDRGPELLWPLFINVPMHIKHLVDGGSMARVSMRIDETGRVIDWVCLELPHYELADAIGYALAEARFAPAMESGQPIAADVVAAIDVGEAVKGSILSLTASEAVQSRLLLTGFKPDELELCAPGDLDRPLSAIERGQTFGVKDADGNIQTGEVWVEFYVDQDGRPRMIRPEDSGRPGLEQAAFLMVEQFRFQPPRHHGVPTVVRARILVVFRSPPETGDGQSNE